jgi:hypothetical protein
MLPREIAPGLWTLAHPMRVLGMEFGTRTTVFRLPSGGLALHSPGRMAPEQLEAIDGLGPVELLISPNLMHYLFITAARERWPAAKVWAAAGLREKAPQL